MADKNRQKQNSKALRREDRLWTFRAALVVTLLVVLLAVGSLIVKDREYSANENRYLAGRPALSLSSLTSGKFMEDTEAYLSDQFVGRDFLVRTRASIDRFVGKREVNGVYIGKDHFLFEKPSVWDDERMTPILTLLDDVHAEILERRETRPVWTPDPSENRTPPDRDTVLAAYRRAFDEMTAAMRGGDYDRDTGWKEAERKAGEFFCFGHPSDEEIRSVFLDFVSCGEILPSPFGSATPEILSWLADTEMDRFPRAFEILDEMEKTVLPPAFITWKKYPPHP